MLTVDFAYALPPLESLDVILQEVRRWRILERGYQG